jgi:hypothetical protein
MLRETPNAATESIKARPPLILLRPFNKECPHFALGRLPALEGAPRKARKE